MVKFRGFGNQMSLAGPQCVSWLFSAVAALGFSSNTVIFRSAGECLKHECCKKKKKSAGAAYCFGICTQILGEHFQHLAESVLQVIRTVQDKKKPNVYSLGAGQPHNRMNMAHLRAEKFGKS